MTPETREERLRGEVTTAEAEYRSAAGEVLGDNPTPEQVARFQRAEQALATTVDRYASFSERQTGPLADSRRRYLSELFSGHPTSTDAPRQPGLRELGEQVRINELSRLPDEGAGAAGSRAPPLAEMTAGIEAGINATRRSPPRGVNRLWFAFGRAMRLSGHLNTPQARVEFLRDVRHFWLTGEMSPAIQQVVDSAGSRGNWTAINTTQAFMSGRVAILRIERGEVQRRRAALAADVQRLTGADPPQPVPAAKQSELAALTQEDQRLGAEMHRIDAIRRRVVAGASDRRRESAAALGREADYWRRRAEALPESNPQRAIFLQRAERQRTVASRSLVVEGDFLARQVSVRGAHASQRLRQRAQLAYDGAARIEITRGQEQVEAQRVASPAAPAAGAEAHPPPLPASLDDSAGVEGERGPGAGHLLHRAEIVNPAARQDPQHLALVGDLYSVRRSHRADTLERLGFNRVGTPGGPSEPTHTMLQARRAYFRDSAMLLAVTEHRIRVYEQTGARSSNTQDLVAQLRGEAADLRLERAEVGSAQVRAYQRHQAADDEVSRLENERDGQLGTGGRPSEPSAQERVDQAREAYNSAKSQFDDLNPSDGERYTSARTRRDFALQQYQDAQARQRALVGDIRTARGSEDAAAIAMRVANDDARMLRDEAHAVGESGRYSSGPEAEVLSVRGNIALADAQRTRARAHYREVAAHASGSHADARRSEAADFLFRDGQYLARSGALIAHHPPPHDPSLASAVERRGEAHPMARAERGREAVASVHAAEAVRRSLPEGGGTYLQAQAVAGHTAVAEELAADDPPSSLQLYRDAHGVASEVRATDVALADRLDSQIVGSTIRARQALNARPFGGLRQHGPNEDHPGALESDGNSADQLVRFEDEVNGGIHDTGLARLGRDDHAAREQEYRDLLTLVDRTDADVAAGVRYFDAQLSAIRWGLVDVNDAAISDIINLGSWVSGRSLEARMDDMTVERQGHLRRDVHRGAVERRQGIAVFRAGLERAHREGRTYEYLALARLHGADARQVHGYLASLPAGGRISIPALRTRTRTRLGGFVQGLEVPQLHGSELSSSDEALERRGRAEGLTAADYLAGTEGRGRLYTPLRDFHPALTAYLRGPTTDPRPYLAALPEDGQPRPTLTREAQRTLENEGEFLDSWQNTRVWGIKVKHLGYVNAGLEIVGLAPVGGWLFSGGKAVLSGGRMLYTGVRMTRMAEAVEAAWAASRLARGVGVALEVGGNAARFARLPQALALLGRSWGAVAEAAPGTAAFLRGSAQMAAFFGSTQLAVSWAERTYGRHSEMARSMRLLAIATGPQAAGSVARLREFLPMVLMMEGQIAVTSFVVPALVSDPDYQQALNIAIGVLVPAALGAYGAHASARARSRAMTRLALPEGTPLPRVQALEAALTHEMGAFHEVSGGRPPSPADFAAHAGRLEHILSEHEVSAPQRRAIIDAERAGWAYEVATSRARQDGRVPEFTRRRPPTEENARVLVDETARVLMDEARARGETVDPATAHQLAGSQVVQTFAAEAHQLRTEGGRRDEALAEHYSAAHWAALEHTFAGELLRGIDAGMPEGARLAPQLHAQAQRIIGEETTNYARDMEQSGRGGELPDPRAHLRRLDQRLNEAGVPEAYRQSILATETYRTVQRTVEFRLARRESEGVVPSADAIPNLVAGEARRLGIPEEQVPAFVEALTGGQGGRGARGSHPAAPVDALAAEGVRIPAAAAADGGSPASADAGVARIEGSWRHEVDGIAPIRTQTGEVRVVRGISDAEATALVRAGRSDILLRADGIDPASEAGQAVAARWRQSVEEGHTIDGLGWQHAAEHFADLGGEARAAQVVREVVEHAPLVYEVPARDALPITRRVRMMADPANPEQVNLVVTLVSGGQETLVTAYPLRGGYDFLINGLGRAAGDGSALTVLSLGNPARRYVVLQSEPLLAVQITRTGSSREGHYQVEPVTSIEGAGTLDAARAARGISEVSGNNLRSFLRQGAERYSFEGMGSVWQWMERSVGSTALHARTPAAEAPASASHPSSAVESPAAPSPRTDVTRTRAMRPIPGLQDALFLPSEGGTLTDGWRMVGMDGPQVLVRAADGRQMHVPFEEIIASHTIRNASGGIEVNYDGRRWTASIVGDRIFLAPVGHQMGNVGMFHSISSAAEFRRLVRQNPHLVDPEAGQAPSRIGGFQLRQQVHVVRSNGQVEGNWYVHGFTEDGRVEVRNGRGAAKLVSAADLSRWQAGDVAVAAPVAAAPPAAGFALSQRVRVQRSSGDVEEWVVSAQLDSGNYWLTDPSGRLGREATPAQLHAWQQLPLSRAARGAPRVGVGLRGAPARVHAAAPRAAAEAPHPPARAEAPRAAEPGRAAVHMHRLPAGGDAVRVADAFNSQHRVGPETRIPDGYVDGGRGMTASHRGGVIEYTSAYREMLVVDRAHPRVQASLEYARSLRAQRPPLTDAQIAQHLAEYVDITFSGQHRGESAAIDRLSEVWANRHTGEVMSLGDVMDPHGPAGGIGVCRHRSLLFKILADEAGLQASLVRGRILGGAHAWNEVVIDGHSYIIDATMNTGTGVGSMMPTANAPFYTRIDGSPWYGEH